MAGKEVLTYAFPLPRVKG